MDCDVTLTIVERLSLSDVSRLFPFDLVGWNKWPRRSEKGNPPMTHSRWMSFWNPVMVRQDESASNWIKLVKTGVESIPEYSETQLQLWRNNQYRHPRIIQRGSTSLPLIMRLYCLATIHCTASTATVRKVLTNCIHLHPWIAENQEESEP